MTDVDVEKKGLRRSGRKKSMRNVYVPTQNLRNQATAGKKRACRATERAKSKKKKKTNKPSKLALKLPTRQFGKCVPAKSLSLSQLIVQNTSPQLRHLLQIAMKIKEDFPTEAKIEFPRYRCKLCTCFFAIEHYRKVSICVVDTIVLKLFCLYLHIHICIIYDVKTCLHAVQL